MAGLKRTDACVMCTVKDSQIMKLTVQLREYKKQLDSCNTEQVQNFNSAKEESGKHKRRRVVTLSESSDSEDRVMTSSKGSEDESEEECFISPRPVATQNRLKTVSGAANKAPSTREEKQRAKAEAQEAKEIRKAVQAFKLQAGPIMKEAMAWKKRGRPFNFSLDISETVFRALVSSVKIATSTSRGYYNNGAKLLTAELDQEDVVEVFGVGRSQQKYRLGSVGRITSMTLDYSSESVEVHGRWTID